MSLIRRDLFREFDNLMAPSTRISDPFEFAQMGVSWRPIVDVTEDEKEYLIKAELPEVNKEDIEVTSNNGHLTITGERKFSKEDKKMHTMERSYGCFERSFNLPIDVKEEEINAEFKDGLLMLHLAKSDQEKSHQKHIHVD